MATAYADELRKLAAELDEARQDINLARQQTTKPQHLLNRARRDVVQAARAVVAAVDAGYVALLPAELLNTFAPREADGTLSDETAFRVWLLAICPVMRSKRSVLKGNAGAYDLPKVKTDEQGFPVGRDGERLKPVKEFDPKTGQLLRAYLNGEVADVTDDYDEADTFEHLRCQAADWADCCAVAADLIRAESHNANSADRNGENLLGAVVAETPADLGDVRHAAIECAHAAAELRRWAATEPAEYVSGPSGFGPEFFVQCLLEAYNKANDAIGPLREEFAGASPIPPSAYGGVSGDSYHAIVVELAERLLQAVADALGTLFFGGLNPHLGKTTAKIAGWPEGFEQFSEDPTTGGAIPKGGARVRIRLEATDLRERLQAIPSFDEQELTARIGKESALAADRRRVLSGANATPSAPPAPNADIAALAERAKLDGLPDEVVEGMRSFSHPLNWWDVEAAAWVYREAHGLPHTAIGGPSKIDFPKLAQLIDHRHAEAWRKNGITPGKMNPADDPRYEIVKRIDADYKREIDALLGLIPMPTPTPPGWEGTVPAQEITTLDQLREYLAGKLEFLRHMGIGRSEITAKIALEEAQDAWRNAWRVFDHLDILHRPERRDDPNDGAAAERKLSELIHWLRTSSTDPAVKSPANAAETKTGTEGQSQETVAPPRLVVTLQPPQAVFDGTAYALKPDGALLIDALLKADGDWLAGERLDMRADRVRKSLPQPIRDLVESSSGKGFRIPRKLLA